MARRKRASRPYQRWTRRTRYRSGGMSMSRILKRLAAIEAGVGPYGDTSSDHYKKFGPNKQQMMDDPKKKRTAAQSRARILENYWGPGSYVSSMGEGALAGAAIGGSLGAGAFSAPGAMVGAAVGAGAGAADEYFSGSGSYEVPVKRGDLINPVHGGNGSAPVYHSAGAADEKGDVIISNRELVTLVTADSAETGETTSKFKVQKFDLNPADSTFHHLRKQASMYEQFDFLGLVFQFIPLTGEGGSNSLGMVGMCADYDPQQQREFSNIEEMMRFKGAQIVKPSVGLHQPVECDRHKRLSPVMFVRDGIDRDKSETDFAHVHFASQGCSPGSVIGQLWVAYSIRLRNVKFTPFIAPNYSLGNLRSIKYGDVVRQVKGVTDMWENMFGVQDDKPVSLDIQGDNVLQSATLSLEPISGTTGTKYQFCTVTLKQPAQGAVYMLTFTCQFRTGHTTSSTPEQFNWTGVLNDPASTSLPNYYENCEPVDLDSDLLGLEPVRDRGTMYNLGGGLYGFTVTQVVPIKVKQVLAETKVRIYFNSLTPTASNITAHADGTAENSASVRVRVHRVDSDLSKL